MHAEQLRMARALLKIDQAEFAKRAGLSVETIKRIERMSGTINVNDDTLKKLVRVLTDAGIELLYPGDISIDGGGGIRVRYQDDEASMQTHVWEVFDDALHDMIASAYASNRRIFEQSPDAIIDACLAELNGSREQLVNHLTARLKATGHRSKK